MIRDGTLVPSDEHFDDADTVEIRPAISGGLGDVEVPGVSRAGDHRPPAPQRQFLRRARRAAVPPPRWRRRSPTTTCSPGRAGARPGERRQGLTALWDLLVELGYQADGIYIGLGIGTFSEERGVCATVRGSAAPVAQTHRPPREQRIQHPDCREGDATCSLLGVWPSKRRLFDDAARAVGYRTIAKGHNLEDEAAVLLGSSLRWDVDALARQVPALPPAPGSHGR